MALFDPTALNPGVARREVFGWAMYDFANSGYTTVVLTAVFNAYFVGVVAGGADWGTLAWTLTLGLSNALVMLATPLLGAWADGRAAKKAVLMATTLGCVAATAALAGVGGGDLWLAVAAIVISNFCYAVGEQMTSAFLPELARREALGRVSGWGWSLGYCGGMLTLGLSLGYVIWAQGQGLPATHFVPVTMLITSAVYALASVATFVLLKERAVPQPVTVGSATGEAWRRLQRTWHEARRYEDFRWLMACAVAYQAGIAVVIALAAIYAEEVLGFKQTQTMMLIFLVNIASAIGAFGFGYWQDRIGHKRALAFTLWGWVLMTVLAVAATTPGLFWVAAVLARARVPVARWLACLPRPTGSVSSSVCGPSRCAPRRSSGPSPTASSHGLRAVTTAWPSPARVCFSWPGWCCCVALTSPADSPRRSLPWAHPKNSTIVLFCVGPARHSTPRRLECPD
jgi:UMF1 family MFS transporter